MVIKKYHEKSFFIMPHSHIDVEWYWNESITRLWSNNILHKALSLMEEDPEFCFTQDQIIVLQWFWKDLSINGKTIFRRMIQEKRLAIVGGMYVMPDVSIPNGECLIRQIIKGQEWLRSTFGIKSECGWFIDTFGQIPQIPQILKRSGYKYNVFWRDIPTISDMEKMPLDFYWISPDGSKILTHWLAGGYGYRPEQVKMILEHSDQDQVLIPFGDDVTVPELNSLEMKENLQEILKILNRQAESYQTATILDYFKNIKENDRKFEEFNLDFNPPYLAYDLRGTYDNRIEVKLMNRKAEGSLLNLETIAAIASMKGVPYPQQQTEELWKKLLITQFHDTLGGSDADPVHLSAMERLNTVYKRSQEMITSTLLEMYPPDDLGINKSIIVFNPLSFPRSGIARFSLGFKNLENIALRDGNGNHVPSKVVQEQNVPYLEFLVENISALGIGCFEYFQEETIQRSNILFEKSVKLIENEHYQIEWAPTSGDLVHIWDKDNNREVLSNPGNAIVSLGEDNPDMEGSLRLNGKILRSSDFELKQSKVEEDELGIYCTLISNYGHCSIQRKIFLQNISRRIDFDTSILNYSGGDEIIKVSFPLNLDWDNVRNTYETPFAATSRPEGHFAAQTWADCSDSDYGITLFNYGTPGYWIGDGSLDLVLLRSFSNYTDYQVNGLKKGIPGYEFSPQTELANEHGSHHYNYSLYPHNGNGNYSELSKIGLSLNNPLYAIKGNSNKTLFKNEADLFSVQSDFLMTAFKLSEDKEQLVLRGYETSGKGHTVHLQVPRWATKVSRANLMEEKEEDLLINSGKVSFTCAPHEIVTILLNHPISKDMV
jgi:alpha-mannosidase